MRPGVVAGSAAVVVVPLGAFAATNGLPGSSWQCLFCSDFPVYPEALNLQMLQLIKV